ncbi:unnamed protein product [Paramecium pentaurelia]|uniref:Protein kinase domain-containing protein n=1 Tax=Paramecium pentaurelia TaxID=43138 RepID=A0A8S1YDF0_9CILI|nr:unnamed protein product [Paramecium pentaurelia]
MDSNLNQVRDKIYVIGSIKNKEGKIIEINFERGKIVSTTQFGDFYQFINVESKEVLIAKIIRKNKIDKIKFRQQVLQEIRIYQQIEHKNFLKFYGTFEDENFIYIILEEYINTLNDYLQEKGQFSESETKQFIIQIVDALNYLHENNILHRDLKLSNIYISKDYQLKIGGFNYAIRLEQKQERRKSICGTSKYLAPDILDNKNGYSFEVDLWYLGIIFYTLLFGVHPFEASDIKIAYQNIKANKLVYKEDVKISENIQKLIDELLNSDANKRVTLDMVIQILK